MRSTSILSKYGLFIPFNATSPHLTIKMCSLFIYIPAFFYEIITYAIGIPFLYLKLPSFLNLFTAAETLSITTSISSMVLKRPKLNLKAPSISLSLSPMAFSTWLRPFLLEEHAEPVDT